jgi:hypothetical protein
MYQAWYIQAPWQDQANTLLELFHYLTGDPTNLMAITAANVYSTFMETPPPPKVTLRRPDLPRDVIWPRSGPGMAENPLHLLTSGVRVANMWQQQVATLMPHTGPNPDEDLLFLA